MNDAATANRTLGFRARLEARVAPLLERSRHQIAEGPRAETLAALTMPLLVEPFEAYVRRLVDALVEGRGMQQAVLDRAWLVENWSLSDHAPASEDVTEGLRQIAAAERAADLSRPPPLWPIHVAPGDLAQALRRTRDRDAVHLAGLIERGLLSPREEALHGGPQRYLHEVAPVAGDAALTRAIEKWPILPCVRVIAAYKFVLEDLHKPAIALDAGKVNHDLMGGWSRAAQDGELFLEPKTNRVELVLPGAENKPAMLNLPLDGERLSQAFIEAIKEWRSFLGLRHWIALQALFSIQGKREGRVLWKLDEHLDALGVSQRWREDPENRAAVAREVFLLSKMELVVYRPDGTVRARHSVLMPATQIEVERGGQWMLEGLELQMHPWLYHGVRDQKTKQLGKHWHPAPPALAKVDHDKFRYALVLGLMLPIRWKWAWSSNGQDYITLGADKLLELACIPHSLEHPARRWETLEANLEELKRIGLLGHVAWEGEPRTTAAKVRLYPAEWLLDRTLQGLHPIEKALPPGMPSKGGELVTWRKARGWTQAELARLMNVNVRTVTRAEVTKDKPLGRTLITALKAYLAQATTEAAKTVTPSSALVKELPQNSSPEKRFKV